MFGAAQDHRAARAAQGFVRGGGDDVGVRHGRRMRATGNKACEVRHVDHQDRADLVGDLAESGEIELARIGRMAGDQQFRTVLQGEFADGRVVEQFRCRIEAVMHNFPVLAGDRRFRAVRQMAAMCELHGKHSIARLEEGQIDGKVGR